MSKISVHKMSSLAQTHSPQVELFPRDDTGLLTITYNNQVLIEIDDMDPEQAQKIINSVEELKKELREKYPAYF